MADQKISQLTALTTQASADELVIVDSSASQTKKITVNNLFQGIPIDVGIGTSSPAENLVVSDASDPVIRIENQKNDSSWSVGQSVGELNFYSSDNSGAGAGDAAYVRAVTDDIYGFDIDLVFGTTTNGGAGSTEAMRIDSEGNVGIGTTSPAFTLDVNSGTTDYAMRIQSTDSTAYIAYQDNSTSTSTTVFNGAIGDAWAANGGNAIRLLIGLNEKARIDSSGNLLVGKTSAAVGTDGAQFLPSGYSGVSATSTTAFFVNRNTTDGNVVEIGKNGVKVGAVGCVSGQTFIDLKPGSGGAGLRGGGAKIVPYVNGADADNAVDIGAAAVRFKDLYLSGGVVFGTTGGAVSSKTLDDYEEGTFTPVVADADSGGNTATVGTVTGTYVKIGKLVYITINLTNITTTGLTGSNTLHVRSLPFTSASEFSTTSYGTVLLDSVNVDDSSIGIVSQVLTNTTVLKFKVSRDATTDIDLTVSTLTSGNADISTTICYQVA